MRSFAAEYMDDVSELDVEVDGVPLSNLFDYRIRSGQLTFTGRISGREPERMSRIVGSNTHPNPLQAAWSQIRDTPLRNEPSKRNTRT